MDLAFFEKKIVTSQNKFTLRVYTNIQVFLYDQETIITSGKYSGKSLKIVWILDPYYIQWLIKIDPFFIIEPSEFISLLKLNVLLDESEDSFIMDKFEVNNSSRNFLFYVGKYSMSYDDWEETFENSNICDKYFWAKERLETLCEYVNAFYFPESDKLLALNNNKIESLFACNVSNYDTYNKSARMSEYGSINEFKETLKEYAFSKPYVSYAYRWRSTKRYLYLLYLQHNCYHINARTGAVRVDGNMESLQNDFDSIYSNIMQQLEPLSNLNVEMINYVSSIGETKDYSNRYGPRYFNFFYENSIDKVYFINYVHDKYGFCLTDKCFNCLIQSLKQSGVIKTAKSGALYIDEPYPDHDDEKSSFEEYSENNYYDEQILNNTYKYGYNFSSYSEWYSPLRESSMVALRNTIDLSMKERSWSFESSNEDQGWYSNDEQDW